MRVAFAGTPEFAAQALSAMVGAGFTPALVLTQPDRPAGRGMKRQASAVKRFAQAHGLPVQQPPTLKSAEAQAAVTATPVDVLVVAAYGLLLPAAILAWPRHGCLNIHASLLPRWRGAAPIQRALLAGDAVTGITLMQMDAGLDTGPIVSRVEVPIAPDDTTGSLHDRLAAAGARAIVDALHRLARDGRLASVAQPAEGVRYAAKIGRVDTLIDWNRAAVDLARQVRALSPAPGATARLGDAPVKIWAAHSEQVPGGAAPDGRRGADAPADPGRIVEAGSAGIVVGCGQGALRVLALQRAGGRRLPAAAFLAGHPLAAGARFSNGDGALGPTAEPGGATAAQTGCGGDRSPDGAAH